MFQVYKTSAQYVDQGGGKRKGSTVFYLELWHADIEAFVEMRNLGGPEAKRCRELFNAVWICDEFMRRVRSDGDWSLFCPSEAKGLSDVWGKEFDELYRKYEATPGLARKVIKARKLWGAIYDAHTSNGTPYCMSKDACNAKSNEQHRGTIKSSNLCAEVVEYSDETETGVCNLASMCLPKYVENGTFNYEKFILWVQHAIKCLNRVLDRGWLPLEECRKYNFNMRSIGLGTQGTSDTFFKLRVPAEIQNPQRPGFYMLNPECATIDRRIWETMYYAACDMSCRLAERDGYYPKFPGSPMSKGLFQFDLWNRKPEEGRHDWHGLRERILKFGLRNSQLLAQMPTASTSSIRGNTESIEFPKSLIAYRKTLAGDFYVPCTYLMEMLVERGLWNEELKNKIIIRGGSIQGIDEVPLDIQELFRTAWEISTKTMMDLSIGRGPFCCMSQSLNWTMANIDFEKWNSAMFYAFDHGLKTWSYYVHNKASLDAIPVTLDPDWVEAEEQKKQKHAAAAKRARDEGSTIAPATIHLPTQQDVLKRAKQTQEPTAQAEEELTEAQICRRDNPGACTSCGT